jgi:hypothetical protein
MAKGNIKPYKARRLPKWQQVADEPWLPHESSRVAKPCGGANLKVMKNNTNES